jgi:hypothetical protein
VNYATLHDDPPKKDHCDDKIWQCVRCKKYILIPHNVVGGAWFLSGWADPTGKKHHGKHCVPCFDELHNLAEDTCEQ